MKASGPAGGVAYLRVTPFAAGQALAARRPAPATGRDSCIVVTGAQAQAKLGRPDRSPVPPAQMPRRIPAMPGTPARH